MKFCKFGIHKWPRGIKDINDWLEHPIDENIEFIGEGEEYDDFYLLCKCLRCGKQEIRRFPHHHFSIHFLNLWKWVDFFTFIWIRRYKLEETIRGDLNTILENRYQIIFLNFEIQVFTKPVEHNPGQPFEAGGEPGYDEHRDITPEEYKEKFGYYPLDSEEYKREKED